MQGLQMPNHRTLAIHISQFLAINLEEFEKCPSRLMEECKL
jgi:hypothetical protein